MSIYSEISDGILLVRPHQAVDFATVEEMFERLTILSDTEIDALVLDLSEARHACAALLRFLLELSAGPDRMDIALVNTGRQFHSLIELCGASALIQEYASVAEAQHALKNGRFGDDAQPAGLHRNDLEESDDPSMKEDEELEDDDIYLEEDEDEEKNEDD